MSTDQRIFISYRRSDCQLAASGLNDGLRNRLPGAQVFMDLDSIPPGADFEEHIRNEIDQCDVVLVLIGDEWLAPQPGTSTRRIDQPNDFVRLEIMSALAAQGVRVIPVLVEGATMPAATELPDDIARLARLNAYVLSDTHWGRDITELTTHLQKFTPGAPAAPATTTSAGPTVTFADIDENAVKYAVADLPNQFATKDVSSHPAMLATHEDVAGRSNYHTMVGRFLMQHRAELGLGSPEAAQGDRGSRWTKTGATDLHVGQEPAPAPSWPPQGQAQPPAPIWPPQGQGQPPPQAPRHAAPQPYPASTQPDPSVVRQRQPVAGLLLIVLAFMSIGFLSFAQPLWAASKVTHDPRRRRKFYIIAGILAGCVVLAFVLPTSIGALLWLGCWVAGIVVAVKYRNPARG
jgi:hypothetical protein